MGVVKSRLKSRQGRYLLDNQISGSFDYLVETDTDATLDEVYYGSLTASPDPVPEVYSMQGSGYVIQVAVAQQHPDNFKRWVVTAQVGQLPEGKNPADGQNPINQNPLYRKAIRSIEFITETVYVNFDRDNNEMTNTNSEPLPEPITEDRDITVFVVAKNYATLAEIVTLNETYSHKSNSDIVDTGDGKTVSAYTLKYAGTAASELQHEGAISFYTGSSRFIYRPETWAIIRANEGYRVKTAASGGKLVNAEDEYNQKVVSPVLIDEDGTRLPEGAPPHELSFDIYPQVAFQTLFDDPTIPP